jgi:hypothetical protein
MKLIKRLSVVKEEQPRKKEMPMMLDLNSRFVYTGGSDVMKVWRRYGFVPPSEVRNDYLFKINREASQGDM